MSGIHYSIRHYMREDVFHFSSIDWEAQWASHAPGYRDGFLPMALKDYTDQPTAPNWPSLLKLKPGPGFGDLSHPSTRIVLQLMYPYVKEKNVLDVGCGSGILSLAALSMGASVVCGIDIDPQAIEHAKINSRLNGMEKHLDFCLPQKCQNKMLSGSFTVLMNMIHTEQVVAWKSLGKLQKKAKWIITSGILVEECAAYLEICRQLGWQLINIKEENGWSGFIFQQ